jgi:ADP-ribose pyrophosphatase YjhB (NUDIX family)
MMKPETVQGMTISGDEATLEIPKLQWRPSAYALIFDDEGRVLLMDNEWSKKKDFPGGGVDIWETTMEGLKREVWEETGLEVQIEKLIYVDESFFLTPGNNHWHTLKFYYQATIIGGTMRATIYDDEPTGFPYWMNPQELKESDLTIGWDALQKALGDKNSSI